MLCQSLEKHAARHMKSMMVRHRGCYPDGQTVSSSRGRQSIMDYNNITLLYE